MMVSYFHSGYKLSLESYISGPHGVLEEGTTTAGTFLKKETARTSPNLIWYLNTTRL